MKTHTFGCEFEYSTPWDDMVPIAREPINKHYGKRSMIAKNDYVKSSSNFKRWILKTDASTECELCTPISTKQDLPKICRVIRDIDKLCPKITKNDSFHVHVSAAGIDPKKIVSLWLVIEQPIIECFPKHRKQRYCSGGYAARLIESTNTSKNVASILDRGMAIAEEHHSALSLYHYESRKTVEFRIGEGTTDPWFVENWVTFCLQFIKSVNNIDPFDILRRKVGKAGRLYCEDIFKILNIKNKKLQNFLLDRSGLFA